MSITPLEPKARIRSRGNRGRKRAWENPQDIRYVLQDEAGMELPPPARKTIDLEGRIVKDGVRKALKDRQITLAGLVHAVREYRKRRRDYALNSPRIAIRPRGSGP